MFWGTEDYCLKDEDDDRKNWNISLSSEHKAMHLLIGNILTNNNNTGINNNKNNNINFILTCFNCFVIYSYKGQKKHIDIKIIH